MWLNSGLYSKCCHLSANSILVDMHLVIAMKDNNGASVTYLELQCKSWVFGKTAKRDIKYYIAFPLQFHLNRVEQLNSGLQTKSIEQSPF